MQMYGPRHESRTLPKVKFLWERFLFALGKEAEFTVSKLAARRVANIRTFSDCQIDVLHVLYGKRV